MGSGAPSITFFLELFGRLSSSTFTVPAGHRLVIDHVSIFADTLGTTIPAGGPWVQIDVAAVSPSPNFRPFDFVARSPSHQLTLHESLRLVFDANESVRVALQAASTGLTVGPGGFSVDVSLTGYIVDCSEVSCEPMVYSLSS